MQHNGNAIQLVPPPPLGFPSFQVVQSLAKGIIENLNKVEAELRQNTGVSLVIKQFEKPGQTQDDLSPSLATKSNSTECHLCKNKKSRNDGKASDCRHVTGTPPNGLQQDMDKVSPTISHSSTTSYAAMDTNNSQQVHDMILSQQTRPRPAINQYGHFMGETSFYCSLSSHLPLEREKTHLDLVMRSPFALSTPVQPPHLTWESQLHLIDVYYTHIHPHLPLINKHDLLLELNHCNQGEPSFLSPLFFYALFARSAPFSSEPHLFINTINSNTMSTSQAVDMFATSCLQYANQLRDAYLHLPRPSTVVALLLMTGYLEQSKQHREFSRVWMWAGEAFRMVLDLGLHRYNSFNDLSSSSSSPTMPPTTTASKKTGSSPLCNTTASFSSMESTEIATSSTTTMGNSTLQQFGIRTFWAAFVTDRSLSLIYGRPFTLEEKDIDVPLPKCLEQDDDKETNGWMTAFHDLIDISKIMGRITKFNYSPHSSQRGPIRHQDAMLSTLDSWITSLLKDFPPLTETATWTAQRQHMNTIRLLELYTLLILLHRPYIHEHSVKLASSSNNPPRPSLDICSHTAMIITQLISDMSTDTLKYLSKASPMVTYAIVLALRIHLINASVTNDQKLGAFGEINFEQTLDVLRKIPMAEGTGTMLTESIDALETQYKQRKSSILSGFNRPYIKHSISSSSLRSGPLDMRLRHTSTQSDCSTSSFESDHGSSKRPYSTDSDYFTSGFTNGSNHGSSSSGSMMAKPMQKLKIIEVHPSKGKQKKLKSTLATSNNNNGISTVEADTTTTNSSSKSKTRSNERSGSGNDDERQHRHSPLSRPEAPYTIAIQRGSESTTPEAAVTADQPNQQPMDVTHTALEISQSTCTNVSQQAMDEMVHYQQHHDFYQPQPQSQQQQQPIAVSVFSNLTSSPTSTQQSFTSAGTTTPGMEYGMNTLFTLGDGLTGDHSSSLLYDSFFTSETNTHHHQQQQQLNSDPNGTMVPMVTADSGLGYNGNAGINTPGGVLSTGAVAAMTSSSSTSSSSSSLHFPFSSYIDSPHIVFSSSQSSPSTSHYIPPQYLPSR